MREKEFRLRCDSIGTKLQPETQWPRLRARITVQSKLNRSLRTLEKSPQSFPTSIVSSLYVSLIFHEREPQLLKVLNERKRPYQIENIRKIEKENSENVTGFAAILNKCLIS